MTKRYSINQSPLFRLRGKKQFANALGISVCEAHELSKANLYRVFVNERGREIQHPVRGLLAIHARVAALLKRIENPNYVHSQKGRSYVGNARAHLGTNPLVKTDVNKFYPSTTHGMVFRMFTEQFECASDLAHSLADLCCYEGKHLPTGSPLSGYVAFFAAKPMFDRIEKIASEKACVMTLFVDDIAISGARANETLLGEVRRIVSEHGHRTRGKKSISFPPNSAKTVTGVIVANSQLRLPNCRRRAIYDARRELLAGAITDRQTLEKQLSGRLREAAQIF
jgi:Reverse transcriptase (RNA-dependent DNA polymerase)